MAKSIDAILVETELYWLFGYIQVLPFQTVTVDTPLIPPSAFKLLCKWSFRKEGSGTLLVRLYKDVGTPATWCSPTKFKKVISNKFVINLWPDTLKPVIKSLEITFKCIRISLHSTLKALGVISGVLV